MANPVVSLLFGDLINKFNLVILGLKLVVLIFIVGWVRTHIGGGKLGTFLMLFIGYLALFRYWFLTGPIAIIYLLAITGVTGLAMDIVFTRSYYTKGGGGMEAMEGSERDAEYANNPAYGMQNMIRQNALQKFIRRGR